MNIIKVKVFDVYKNNDTEEYYKSWIGDRNISDFHMAVINKDGFVKNDGIKLFIRSDDISEIDKFVLDDAENGARQMLHSSTKKAKDVFDSCLRKEERFDELLLDKICKSINIGNVCLPKKDTCCNISPFGYCVCVPEGKCIFCKKNI